MTTDNMINLAEASEQEVITEWLRALRSGEYKQGRRVLKDDDGAYCCLGVLCELVGAPTEGQMPIYPVENKVGTKNFRLGIGTRDYVLETYGDRDPQQPSDPDSSAIRKAQMDFLPFLNDKLRLTFDEIADLIERFGFR
jgi:hypothetical protein